ncbi:FAD-dependent oxidoreductase [Roseococcus sp. SDR]|uniref:FAD-dependent oxidoreductase n=1 Tax=Roseococcus sp. SDR TaxID=2835532 RepID=UPI001BCCB7A7|nr:FAD-dependent oxidoreductase [Roseococcus sp. SDR]MBS7790427.1 FAD-dependent oxidoreductase [Roseococcus sp. SDR]MBV1845741.1 FAD-dependent oxidoreductase [Roseococcus sp. SDR]
MSQPPDPEGGRLFFRSETFAADPRRSRRTPTGETVPEPGRDIPLHARCDVLVVGGGPSGVAAAVAAARLGARTLLLERHNHLGGLSTGGLVIWIDRMTDWSGQRVIRGFAEEFLGRLPQGAVSGPSPALWGARDAATAAWWAARTSAFHGVVTHSPTCDPEAMKLAAQEMVLEAGAELLFHAWGAEPIVSDGTVRGVFFESKQGRRAILAGVTVDATGDGDLFARAGAAFNDDVDERDIHHCMNTSWLFGGVNMPRYQRWRAESPEQFSAFLQRGRERTRFFDKAFASWRDDVALFMGPRLSGYSAVDVDDLTAVEIQSHRLMAEHLALYRAEAPGFENAYLMLSAPQLGVRHARRLAGMAAVTRGDWDGRVRADEIGVSPSLSPRFPNVSVPYGALLPAVLDGLLAPGRHLSCDPNSHSFLREIPQCWLTGQAAGVAAALAVARGIQPRAVPIAELQAALRAGGAHLSAPAPDRAIA